MARSTDQEAGAHWAVGAEQGSSSAGQEGEGTRGDHVGKDLYCSFRGKAQVRQGKQAEDRLV